MKREKAQCKIIASDTTILSVSSPSVSLFSPSPSVLEEADARQYNWEEGCSVGVYMCIHVRSSTISFISSVL